MHSWAWRKNGRPTLAVTVDLREQPRRKTSISLSCSAPGGAPREPPGRVWGSLVHGGWGARAPALSPLPTASIRPHPPRHGPGCPRNSRAMLAPQAPILNSHQRMGETGWRGSLSQMHQATCTPDRTQLPGVTQERAGGHRRSRREKLAGLFLERHSFLSHSAGSPDLSVSRRLLWPSQAPSWGSHQHLEGPGPREQSPEGGLVPEALV